ncbi:MAG: hypothetical protein J7K23_08675 [Thermoproteales archaeon]|nr:hypothetical protein [Thermoproteales archaeon]
MEFDNKAYIYVVIAALLGVFSGFALFLKFRNDDRTAAMVYLSIGIVSEIAFWLGVYFGKFIF